MEVPESFLDALESEVRLVSASMSGVSFGAVYFGGGTPSLLRPDQFTRIVRFLQRYLSIDLGAELTFEGEPASLRSPELLSCLRDHGVNRVSFGLQTFHDRTRSLLGRTDTIHDIYELRECLEKIGFDEINVDYLYCLPGSDIDFLLSELKLLHDYSPSSVDCHPLKYASCSHQMLRQIVQEHLSVPEARDRIDMFETIRDALLTDGFSEQFVDQYSKVKPTTTNRYMRYLYGLDGGEYLGIGPGARSHYGDYGLQNVGKTVEYGALLRQGTRPIRKVVRAPLSDNYVACFPKRNDILLLRDVQSAASHESIRRQLDALLDGGFLELVELGYQLTPLGLRWYQNVQEDLLSDQQRRLHLETLSEREKKLLEFDGYFAGLGRA